MPEGDTVFVAARSLHRALAGRTLLRAEIRVPSLATVDLSGQVVSEVGARGKHLLLRTDAGWTLHTHLGMDGCWRVQPAVSKGFGVPAFQVRVILLTDSNRAVGSNLPLVELLRTSQEERRLAHLGPDLLAPDFQVDESLRRLRARPERMIADALLDQRNLAGIGNLFKSEVLFMTAEDPWTPVGQVRDLPGMVALARRLLQASCRDGGLQSTTGRRSPAEKNWVFRRQGHPCRRCGELVRVARQGGVPGQERLTWWCPRCQAGPFQPAGRLRPGL